MLCLACCVVKVNQLTSSPHLNRLIINWLKLFSFTGEALVSPSCIKCSLFSAHSIPNALLYCMSCVTSVSMFPGKKILGKGEEIKRPGIPGIPGISRPNQETFAISREFPGTNTMCDHR